MASGAPGMSPGIEPGVGYALPIASERTRRVARNWLMLALVSLVGAGLFSILLVLARTPGIGQWIPWVDFFRIALVVHVDLSVLIWLLSMAGVFWGLYRDGGSAARDSVAFGLAAAGAGIIALSPFVGAGDPLMNNYVPLLRHPVFYAGLGLFALGIALHLARALLELRAFGHSLSASLTGSDALRAGVSMAALITAVAILALGASWAGLPPDMTGAAYFEFLFWGSGHVLQFSHTLLMMVAWVVLAGASGCRFALTPRLLLTFFVLLGLPVITVPFFYLAHDVMSPGHRLAFTELMKYGGLSCLPLGLAVLASLFGADRPDGEGRYLRSALVASLTLFGVGGILGFLISGLDIVIPAHYHGSTVGVTIAFMGLAYYLLPRLGFGQIPGRMAFWQPIVYGGGQLMHIMGLAWTGGYGVGRKTAGVAQGLDRAGEVAGMGLMGLGGAISVVGGLLFLVVAWRSIRGGAHD
jgi:hypothetical protein